MWRVSRYAKREKGRAGTFENCVNLTSVTLPNTVTTIGERAFKNCRELTSITLPNAVTIERGAFCDCPKLTSVVFRPPVSWGAFVCWAVGSSRNRDNCQLTTLRHLRNVLRLITTFALWSLKDGSDIDPFRIL
jgi:hypothetical protein